MYEFFWKPHQSMERILKQFLIIKWLMSPLVFSIRFHSRKRWKSSMSYVHASTRSAWLNTAHSKVITNMPFCRAWKTASTWRISFHISFARKKFSVSYLLHKRLKTDISDKILHPCNFFSALNENKINRQKCAEFHALSF